MRPENENVEKTAADSAKELAYTKKQSISSAARLISMPLMTMRTDI